MNNRRLAMANMKVLGKRGQIGAERIYDAVHDEMNDERGEYDNPTPATVWRYVVFEMLTRCTYSHAICVIDVLYLYVLNSSFLHFSLSKTIK